MAKRLMLPDGNCIDLNQVRQYRVVTAALEFDFVGGYPASMYTWNAANAAQATAVLAQIRAFEDSAAPSLMLIPIPPPTVTSINGVTSGSWPVSLAHGSTVTLVGTGFFQGMAVNVGLNAGVTVTFISTTQCTFRAPTPTGAGQTLILSGPSGGFTQTNAITVT